MNQIVAGGYLPKFLGFRRLVFVVNRRESTGLDGGLKALREQPYGVYMLTAVGPGLIFYRLSLMVKAKFARM